jgi:hypothetical protein
MVRRSVAYSVWVLLRETVRHWLLFVGGAVASLAGWILQARDANLPTQYFLYVGAALFVIAFVRAWHGLRLERDQLLDDRAPKFEIVFVPTGESDSRPYLQTLAYPDQAVIRRVGMGMFEPDEVLKVVDRNMVDRRYRVGIVNLSSATVPDVSLTLVNCTPAGNFVHLGHHLLVMDTDPRLGRAALPPSADSQPTLFFDVVNENAPADTIPNEFLFCYANERLTGPIRAGAYDIELRADGGNVSSTRRFRVSKSWHPTHGSGRLVMTPL